jgi:hypothetical protein
MLGIVLGTDPFGLQHNSLWSEPSIPLILASELWYAQAAASENQVPWRLLHRGNFWRWAPGEDLLHQYRKNGKLIEEKAGRQFKDDMTPAKATRIRTPFFPPPEVLASYFRRRLKSSSPQRPPEDIQIISAVFAGSVIIEGFGKLSAIAHPI